MGRAAAVPTLARARFRVNGFRVLAKPSRTGCRGRAAAGKAPDSAPGTRTCMIRSAYAIDRGAYASGPRAGCARTWLGARVRVRVSGRARGVRERAVGRVRGSGWGGVGQWRGRPRELQEPGAGRARGSAPGTRSFKVCTDACVMSFGELCRTPDRSGYACVGPGVGRGVRGRAYACVGPGERAGWVAGSLGRWVGGSCTC
jgi:hypothetical protein